MNNLDKQYLDLCNKILTSKHSTSKLTRNGSVQSIFGAQIRHNMADGFPVLTTKRMAFKQIVTELLWFLRGETNIKYMLDNGCNIWVGDAYANYKKGVHQELQEAKKAQPHLMIDYWPMRRDEFIDKLKTDDEFAKQWGELGPVYGKQWRWWQPGKTDEFASGVWYQDGPAGIDQIANLIDTLKTDPDDRRMLVSAWNPGELDKMVLPPCHYSFQVYTRELSKQERRELLVNRKTKLSAITDEDYEEYNIPTRAISLMWNQRSVDVPLGLPFNIASYGLLLVLLGHMVNMVPEELIGNLGDTHIYKNQISGIQEQMSRTPAPLPKLVINTQALDAMKNFVTSSGNTSEQLDELIFNLQPDWFKLEDYNPHPTISFPLSN